MSSTTPLRLGAPQPEQHAVLAVLQERGMSSYKDVIVAIASWDVALGIHGPLEQKRFDGEFASEVGAEIKFFCVRSVSDPRVQKAVGLGSYQTLSRGTQATLGNVQRQQDIARRAYVHKRLGEFALAAVKDESLDTFGSVVRRVREDANRFGLNMQGYEIQDAVKSRVMLGRVSYPGNSLHTRRKGTGYFIRKSDGPLHKVRIQPNNVGLDQSSLAYHGTFYRLIKQDDDTFVAAGQSEKVG